jgi:hypothetical protein
MVTLRCTQKLLKRLSQPLSEVPPQPTTLLGDWYANILFSKPQQLVLCISERTLLPVILPAKDIHTFSDRFVVAVHEVLTALGVAPQLADRECSQMQHILIGKTNNRQILGSLNDLLFHFDYYLYAEPSQSLLQHSLFLSTIICKPIGYNSPKDVTLELFGSGSNIGHTIH